MSGSWQIVNLQKFLGGGSEGTQTHLRKTTRRGLGWTPGPLGGDLEGHITREALANQLFCSWLRSDGRTMSLFERLSQPLVLSIVIPRELCPQRKFPEPSDHYLYRHCRKDLLWRATSTMDAKKQGHMVLRSFRGQARLVVEEVADQALTSDTGFNLF